MICMIILPINHIHQVSNHAPPAKIIPLLNYNPHMQPHRIIRLQTMCSQHRSTHMMYIHICKNQADTNSRTWSLASLNCSTPHLCAARPPCVLHMISICIHPGQLKLISMYTRMHVHFSQPWLPGVIHLQGVQWGVRVKSSKQSVNHTVILHPHWGLGNSTYGLKDKHAGYTLDTFGLPSQIVEDSQRSVHRREVDEGR